jgi:transposase, IS5 family
MKRKPSPAEKMLAQAAVQAVETDPVLSELDTILDAGPLYQQACAKLDKLDEEAVSGEVLLRMLLVKHLYDWSEQQTAEQVQDSLALRWFCRLGLQPAPAESLVSQAAGHVSVSELEALASKVEQASERAKESEGRLRPTCRQRWR